jgi:hypothetical protein
MPRTGQGRPFYGVPTDELKPGTASTAELRQQYGTIIDNIPFVRKTTRQGPRQDRLNRPLISRPLPQQSTRPGVGGGGPVLPQMDLTPSTEDKVVKPWYMEPKKVLPLAIGAAALFYLFTKKR